MKDIKDFILNRHVEVATMLESKLRDYSATVSSDALGPYVKLTKTADNDDRRFALTPELGYEDSLDHYNWDYNNVSRSRFEVSLLQHDASDNELIDFLIRHTDV